MSAADAALMARAIRLAERGLYGTAPNPRVGCVIARDGEIIAEGWHRRAGEAHAEVEALRQAGERARGATAYVSLEPCNHQGRTGPCSEALRVAGIARVVYAAADQGAGSGGGAQALRDGGIQVEGGLLEAEARALNPGFHRRQAGGLPWVRMKIAQSLDGRTALPDGRSQWITGAEARQDGHLWRARSCAIVTGTVLADDPQMNVRLPPRENLYWHQPLRVVLDTRRRTGDQARFRQDGHYLVMHGLDADEDARSVVLPRSDSGLDLRACIAELGRRGCNEILIEAGARLNGAFLKAGLVDEIVLYVAPDLLGEGRGAAELGVLADLDQRIALTGLETRRIGRDSRIIARLQTAL